MTKVINSAALIGSVAALLGAFMPMADLGGGALYVGIEHMQGLPYLLYALPVLTLGIAAAGLYRPTFSTHWWFMGAAIVGLIISYLTIDAARDQVSAFSRGFGRSSGEAGSIGIGGMLCLAGFWIAGVAGSIQLYKGRKVAAEIVGTV